MCDSPTIALLAFALASAPGIPGRAAPAPAAAPPPAPDAATILRRADRAVLGESAAYTLRMTVVRPNKPERVVEMKGWKKGDDQGLVRYTAPAKERGTAYLRSGENTWLFLPSAEKVVRVGAKQNFGGGDFSNADIFRLSLIKDYDPTLAGEEAALGQPCYKLELKAKDRSIAYDRVVYWVKSDGSFYPVRADYYTLSGKNLKSLVLSQVKPLGGRTRPTLMTMESRVDEGSRTLLEFLAIQDDPKLDERLFAPSALERGE
jgi:outer membrane lipoprotein-sorting protein